LAQQAAGFVASKIPAHIPVEVLSNLSAVG
jgi:hypothetical protein